MGFQRFLDMRYVGQEFPIQTPVGEQDLLRRDPELLRTAFDRIHDRRFGHQAVDEPVEIVNLRLTATGCRKRSQFPKLAAAGSAAKTGERAIVLEDPKKPVVCGIYDRDRLAAGDKVTGPAVITEYASTTLLFAGDAMTVAPSGELIIRIAGQ
jgi:N-methylhydantoinase A